MTSQVLGEPLISKQEADGEHDGTALVQVAERESRRIAQELHTNLCQQLVGIAFLAKALADQHQADDVLSDRLQELSTLISASVQQTRSFNVGADLAAGGISLIAAIQGLAASTPSKIQVLINCPSSIDVRDANIALNLYRIAQEAVANAALHSRGSQVVVSLTKRGDVVTLRVADDGQGTLEDLQAKAGMGLTLMRLRAQAISATLRFETSSAGGICVNCSVTQRP